MAVTIRTIAIRLVVGGLLGALCLAVVSPAEARRTTTTKPTRTGELGLAVPGWPADTGYLDSLVSRLGHTPDQLTYYAAWATVADFPFTYPGAGVTRPTVELVWEPWDPAAGTDQPAYSLDTIASGAHDAYLRRWAAEIQAYQLPVNIRLAHEMNGSWYPWSEQVNGNGPGDYAAAWRHVVDVFRAAGVTNVRWVWAPNVEYPGSTGLAALYPGDAYVDRLGVDGYNWGTTQSWSSWQSFGQVFGPTVSALRSLAPNRPIYVTETASTEVGGSKSAWISDMWKWLDAHPEVRGISWFSFDKETDWRIDSSKRSLDAFRAGLWPSA